MTSVEEFSNSTKIEIMPNPAFEQVRISHEIGFKSLILYNMAGQKLLTEFSNNALFSSKMLDVSNLPKGMYLLEIQIGNERFFEKLMKL